MATERFKLPLADIQMAMEMYDASPDGQAERARVQRVLEENGTPGTLQVNGYWVCANGRCGTCYDCRND